MTPADLEGAAESSDRQWDVRHDDGGVLVRQSDAAVHVRLNRPDALNAFDFDLTRHLSSVIQELGADDGVRAVLISGSGRAFSAGADVKTAFDPRSRDEVGDHLRRYTKPMIMSIRSMPKPVVAAVHGAAVGAGCSLAIACDFVLAAESATFHLAFSRVALGGDGGAGTMVMARAGFSVASRMMLLAEPMTAATAYAAGLAERVVPDADLASSAEQLLLELAAGPTGSYAASKQVLNLSMPMLAESLDLEADLQEELLASPDFAEALQALLQKRTPQFGR